jgi:hypothetical protein
MKFALSVRHVRSVCWHVCTTSGRSYFELCIGRQVYSCSVVWLASCGMFLCTLTLFRLCSVIFRSCMMDCRPVTIMRDTVSRRSTFSFRYLSGSIPKRKIWTSSIHLNLLQFVNFEFLKSVILKIRYFRDVTLCLWVVLDVWKNCCKCNFRVRPSKGLALFEYED